MRATLVNHRYAPFPGGSELYTQNLAQWLSQHGWKVRVITSDAFDLEYLWDRRFRAVKAPAHESLDGVVVNRISIAHPPLSRWMFPISRRAMVEGSRVVKGHRPFDWLATHLPRLPNLRNELERDPDSDILIATNLSLEGMAIQTERVARSMDCKFVFIPFAHLGTNVLTRRYISMPHQRRLVQSADMLIALTDLEAEWLVQQGANPKKVVVAGAGVDLSVSMQEPTADVYEGLDDHPIILSIGALAPDKGTIDLVRASRVLHSQGIRHRLILIGPELGSFTSWMDNSGAAGCGWIERPGVVSDDEKARLLSMCDVFALPSRTESFGIVYLEAWAHRKPVVAAAVGAVNEVVDNNVDGLLVPFGQPTELARALHDLLTDSEFAAQLGGAGRMKVEQTFSWEHVLSRIGEGFHDILEISV